MTLDLSRRSPLKTGGVVRIHYPETLLELAEVRALLPRVPLVGALSNVVVFDNISDLISTRRMKAWKFESRTTIEAACGCMMPTLVSDLAKHGFGGFEYLISVPGTIGGGVFMNAGRGRNRPCIGDRVLGITAINEHGDLCKFTRRELGYAYRWCSLLRDNPGLIVTSVLLRIDHTGREDAEKRIRDRLVYVNERQDRKRPSLGSVFRSGYKIPLGGMSEGGMQFSEKTANWIVNVGGGSAVDYERLVNTAKALHVRNGLASPEEEIIFIKGNS